MKRRFLVGSLAVVLALSLTSLSTAEEGIDWGFGSVVSVDTVSGEILISEYDYESETATTVAYTVNDETEIGAGMSLESIPLGCEVSIEYHIGDNGNKIAVYINMSDEE